MKHSLCFLCSGRHWILMIYIMNMTQKKGQNTEKYTEAFYAQSCPNESMVVLKYTDESDTQCLSK